MHVYAPSNKKNQILLSKPITLEHTLLINVILSQINITCLKTRIRIFLKQQL